MDQMISANIALDIFGIILSIIPIVYVLSSQRYCQQLNRYFLGVSISNIFMITGDLSDWLIQDVSTRSLQVILSVFSVVYYAASAFVLYFFARYLAEYLKITGRAVKRYLAAVRLVCSVQIFFAIISPFTGAIFYISVHGYQRGNLFLISQIVPLFCYILFTAFVIVYRENLTLREIAFFLLYIFVPLGGGAAQMFLRGIAVVNIGVSLALLLILVNIQFEYELTLRKKEDELAQMRIDIMLSQIQPHFLYNSLATISHLCKHDAKKAQTAIQEFSLFLRGNMDSLKKRNPISFEKELNHVKNYLYLEQQRFQNRLKVIYDIQVSDFYLPPLSLQPLVENSVRHGVLRKEAGGVVTIRTRETKQDYLVIVEDNGIGFERSKEFPNLGEHAHIGIENVRSRLQTMVHGSLKIDSDDMGTSITMRIPKE
ncbi:Inner membrane protein ypdA [uncultured Roseburia sp.]|uniref:Histidine kinase n=1 Tax=Brotonthovivens ammoniilytica TaxID=2981725 RepID=A0ABT2TF02_9FIRM|nr:histidine kinase [Brotonthovivens ammoniilytica]MCU6760716.1 histidine kinase [Brotonthovivens ammoniilytica]SCI06864.1 Inner membrane protein ypdA [uncultured Roseburia sp.]